ncbi:MAG: TIGR03790 family protein [Candidatus Didemnitutus sp.]|nr:TIGR03790 family protein [Candidatus Didemnitutus sp.]
MIRIIRTWALLLGMLGAGGTAGANLTEAEFRDLTARTVILVNSRQPESVELGEFYAKSRGIPLANIVALPLPVAETITWREFVDQVWQPLQDELVKRDWIHGYLSEQLDTHGRRRSALSGHRLAYLVLCRGTPLRIGHDPTLLDEVIAARLPVHIRRNDASVDSELTLLAQSPQATIGFLANPLFKVNRISKISAEQVVKVSRLDGPTLSDAMSLVKSALSAEENGLVGRYYIDLAGPHITGDAWLDLTRAMIAGLGFMGEVHRGSSTFEATDRFDAPVLYFGWYNTNVNGPFLRDGFRFAPGAVALHIHSYSASTLRSTTEGWCGPLVARGVAATFGNVFEPYLEFTVRPDMLIDQLATGATLGDAAFFATPVLSWQGVVLGDPLYRPFKIPLEDQLARLAKLPSSLAGHVIARKAAALEKLEMIDEARALLARGMREYPSLSLALVAARFELAQRNALGGARMLGFVPLLRDVSLGDWPLVREAAEFVAAHGSVRDALPIYQLLVRSAAPTPEAKLQILGEARKAADSAGNMQLSLEFSRMAAELTPPLPAIKHGK